MSFRTETTAHPRRAKEAHARPYAKVMVALALVTLFEVVMFTPVGVIPANLQLLHLLTKGQILLVLLAFAAFKASLVAAYYMHLKYESRWIRLIPIVPLIGVAALFATFAFK
ncbi:MAG TPA: cytochrome C oxidase subunit IV family protein [Thermoplasmata archaeon]|nr:cytochrome C oxidase subunit IV family protein [Thermoplasmata archaeon]